MSARDLLVSFCSLASSRAPKRVRRLEAGSAKAFGLTQRAADGWVCAAFLGIFRGFELVPFRERVSSHPPVANARRWLAGHKMH